MRVDLPEIYNAATTFVDNNIAEGRGGKVAIYYEDQKITYQEVFENVNRTGNALKELGIGVENRVLVILPDSPEFAYSFFGAIKIGAVAVPTNPWMFAKDYEYLINDSRAQAIIVHESTFPEIEKIRDATPFLKHIIVVGTPSGKALAYEPMVARASAKLEAEKTTRDDVCFWGYTSGSTGTPKGAVHLQHDMITISDLFVKPVLGMHEKDLCFSASKMFFAYGRVVAGKARSGKNSSNYRQVQADFLFLRADSFRAVFARRKEIRPEFFAHLSFIRRALAAGDFPSMEGTNGIGTAGRCRFDGSDA
jgi:benzoate-CoA ligase